MINETLGSVSGDCEIACQVLVPGWKYGSRESELWGLDIIEMDVVRGPERDQKRRLAEGERPTSILVP